MTAHTPPQPTSRNLVGRLIDWLHQRREIRELDQLDAPEFSRLAAELNMAPADLDSLVRRGPRAADEMLKLLRALGFDEGSITAIQPTQRQNMERTCANCVHKAACDNDLFAGTSTENYASYCNNADEIGTLLQNRADRADKSAAGLETPAR